MPASSTTPPTVLEGTLERITFYNEENGYTVGRLRATGGDAPPPPSLGLGERVARAVAAAKAGAEPQGGSPTAGASGGAVPGPARTAPLVTFIGNFPALRPGENLRLEGVWVDHPEYGRQFKVATHQIVLPHTRDGVERYLASGFVHGVGPATAKRLVKHFGKDVLEILEAEPGRLTEVAGIGARRARDIAKAFEQQKSIKEVMVFLQSVGVSPALAMRIHRHYGNGAVGALRDNPYRLADEVFGIGFKTADRIALTMGVPTDSPGRIQAGLRYFLGQMTQEGHVFGPREYVERRVAEGLEVDADLVAAGTEALVREGLLHLERVDAGLVDSVTEGAGEGVVEGEAVYLAPLYHAERFVAEKLLELSRASPELTPPEPAEVAAAAEEAGIELSPEQSLAVREALGHGVLIVTGGPGTGKTTIINCLLRLCRARGLAPLLAAPTGRGAKRMTEATGCEARTIHRTLGVVVTPMGGLQFQHNEDEPLEADIAIIDEVSMVDLLLMHHLLRAIEPPTRLVLVGDVDQLPAVGPGSVLRDLINSGALPVMRLTRIFRQAQESLIVVNAHRVNQGRMPLLGQKDGDFFFIEESAPDKVLATIVSLCAKRLPERLAELGLGADPLSAVQVISPMRRTVIGVENLNAELQKALNPPGWGKAEIAAGRGYCLRTGDKVMQIRNNYNKEVFNGDIGVIRAVDQEEGQVAVAFPEEGGPKIVVYERDELDELVLAYATTVHKSQGSEYPAVVMPVSTQHYLMLQRHLLYTAITRARKLVVLVGTKKALAIAVHNRKLEERFSRLSDRLRHM